MPFHICKGIFLIYPFCSQFSTRSTNIRQYCTFACAAVLCCAYGFPIPRTHGNARGEEERRSGEKKEIVAKAFPFYKLLSYADALDWTLMALGTLGSIVHGMAQPIGYLLLGKALNAFGDNINDTDAMVKAIKRYHTKLYMSLQLSPPSLIIVENIDRREL